MSQPVMRRHIIIIIITIIIVKQRPHLATLSTQEQRANMDGKKKQQSRG